MPTVESIRATAPAAPPRVCVVVLNWNGGNDTLECLRSLDALTYPNWEPVLVDNGSTDGSTQQVRDLPLAHRPTILETGANLGFAEGNNVGIRHALAGGADFVLLLNNDTIVDPGLIDALVEAAQASPRAAILSCKILYYDRPDRIWYAGAEWLPGPLQFAHTGFNEPDGARFDVLRETGYASGCVFFMRATALRSIGLLDPRYFLTYEESDLCYRARRAGFGVLYVPQGRVWHKVSASFGGAESPLQLYFYSRNRLLWAEQHLPRRDYWRLLWKTVTNGIRLRRRTGATAPRREPVAAEPSRRRLFRRRAANPARRARLLGVRDYLLRRFGDCPDEVRQLRARAPS